MFFNTAKPIELFFNSANLARCAGTQEAADIDLERARSIVRNRLLLADATALTAFGTAVRPVLLDYDSLGQDGVLRLASIAHTYATNWQLVDAAAVGLVLLPLALPAAWRLLRSVPAHTAPQRVDLLLCGTYAAQLGDLRFCQEWPLLLTLQGDVHAPLPLPRSPLVTVAPDQSPPSPLISALAALGCPTISAAALNLPPSSLARIAHPLTGTGVLRALAIALSFRDASSNASSITQAYPQASGNASSITQGYPPASSLTSSLTSGLTSSITSSLTSSSDPKNPGAVPTGRADRLARLLAPGKSREALRAFLLLERWYSHDAVVDPSVDMTHLLQLLRDLPIYLPARVACPDAIHAAMHVDADDRGTHTQSKSAPSAPSAPSAASARADDGPAGQNTGLSRAVEGPAGQNSRLARAVEGRAGQVDGPAVQDASTWPSARPVALDALSEGQSAGDLLAGGSASDSGHKSDSGNESAAPSWGSTPSVVTASRDGLQELVALPRGALLVPDKRVRILGFPSSFTGFFVLCMHVS